MGLDSRDYMRDVPIYRRLVGREPATSGSGGGGRKPPTAWADPPKEPSWWGSVSTRGTRARRARTRPWAWFLLGVFVTLAAVGYVSERGVPSLGRSPSVEMSPLAVAARVSAPLRIPLQGPEQVRAGTTVMAEGFLPLQHGRVVLLRARWNGGPWQGVGAVQTADDGAFRVRYRLNGRGTAQLRIVIPRRGFAYKWFRVT